VTVLVTGGSGFIGSHTVKCLLSKGYKVRVLDLVPPHSHHKNLEFYEGNILDLDSCLRSIQGITHVLHLAAYSRSGPSVDNWKICLETNITGTQNMLEACLSKQIDRFVYAGSSTFYGNRIGVQKVGDPGEFLNFYGLSKYFGEELVTQFAKQFGISSNILRYFNVYGSGQPTEGPYGLVMGIFAKAFRENRVVEIHGTGEQRRDFIHVEDVAEANVAALETRSDGNTLNIGSGSNVSINELAELFDLKFVRVPRRIGDAEITLADIGQSRSILNWEPKISLPVGIENLKNDKSI
jgi:nucleoside-diphosphate-sugar epimerase